MNFRKTRAQSRRNSMNIILDTGKWQNYGKRISQRDFEAEEEESDDEPKYNEIKDWVQQFFERNSECSDQNDQDVEVKLTNQQTLILSTLVPDEILLMEKFDTNDLKRFVGVVLMADVSGYTALSERYNNTGKGGTYRLTVTLNTYLGSLIELIYAYGGDVLKFSGDAFLALWKTDKRTFLCHTIHNVIACALVIQHSYSSYETDVKVNLKVKLAIAAGNLLFATIGTGIDMNYVLFGLPVEEAKAAESCCASGEVTLTPTAWGHCYSRNYDYTIQQNGYVTIKAILYDPRENDVMKPFIGFGGMIRQIRKTCAAVENLPDHSWETSDGLSHVDLSKKIEMLNLRKAILLAEGKNIGSELRKFMIRPILTQIDAHQPLEYLTEMRQVSILFITLKPTECPFPQLITIVNNSYQITCEIVYKSMGCVNKIILFDKDVMMLIIFGLRGYKHESEAQAALKCAFSIKKSVSALGGVREVSVGVTTGQVYCGVVGHPLRQEFTVIGATVNKAARLMCKFRNKITCDETTFIQSKMSTNAFTQQPKTELKGIIHPGKIFEYTEDIRAKEIYEIPIIPPLLNRKEEIECYQSWLDQNNTSFRQFDALLLIGESRIGKSRTLEWMARYARNYSYHVTYINLTSIHSANAYLALSEIVNQMLDLKEPIHGFVKEEKIVQLLKVYNEDLCYLNKIIRVRFAYQDKIQSLNEQQRKEKTKQVFMKLLKAIANTHVVFLDDLQNLDSFSWEFVKLMFTTMKIFTVFSVTRGKFSAIQNWLYDVFTHNSIRKIVLGPLSSNWIAPLACQILDIDAVPNDLCNALRIKCQGMPGFVESFIIHLFSIGALEVKKIKDDEIEQFKSEDLQFPETSLLQPQAVRMSDQSTLDELLKNDSKEFVEICIVTKKSELNLNINCQNLDALIMIQIDSLTPYQQLLLKIASIVGTTVSRILLESIMYNNDWLTTAKAIKRLFAMRILSCANVNRKWYRNNTSTSTTSSDAMPQVNLACDCSFDHDPDAWENLPKYAFCKVMKFKNKNARKTCYELLPVNQKKEFHARIINYLETNRQKCQSCGGTIMIVQSKNYMLSLETDHEGNLQDKVSDTGSNSDWNETDTNLEMKSTDRLKSNFNSVLDSGTTVRPSDNIVFHDEASNNNFTPILKRKSTDDVSSIKLKKSIKRVTMTSLNFRKASLTNFESYKIFDMLRAVSEAKTVSDWNALGAIDSQDHILTDNHNKSFNVRIEKGVSHINFNKCTCAELKIVIYEQLMYHAQKAEQKIKLIDFTIKYCYLNLLANNTEKVFPKLEEAERMCLEKNEILSVLDQKRFLGKILSIKAAACLICGKLTAAKRDLIRASRIYNFNFLKVSGFISLNKLFNFMKIEKRKNRLSQKLMKSDAVFFLNVTTLLYSTLGDDSLSRNAALTALDYVQRVECNLIDLCETYSNAIQVEIDRGTSENTEKIEKLACQSLRQLQKEIKAEELYAIGKLFSATFKARVCRGKLAESARSGFRALTISRFLQAYTVSLDIIPDLFYVLLARRRIEEAIDVVRLTLRLGHNQISLVCETWYYALCIDLILDAGFQLETPQEISRFAEYALESGKSGGQSRRRLVVGLWTYWLRVDIERKAKRFENEALSWMSCETDNGSLTTLISAMRLAEGMLESLARKVDDLRKVVDIMELRSIADKELTGLEADARLIRSLYPRWLLLKANSLKLSGRSATSLLNQSLEESRRTHNRLEEALTLAALSQSVIWKQTARTGVFMHWKDGIDHVQTSWHQLLYKITTTRQTSF
ncbi:adenylate cyclase type 10 isoform X1 [Bombyx mori]|uniref:Guanylate cyclase domain-containing protein n=1 Tax=Bombyx mori TaxID=7091 RepID=A0A8R2QT32_BOMMO|nr:adenylate cyclase type 10 isoform X1 [Bombyx mori]XP_037867949.1 adenylate cyclase type 10 isoform X1 [Bombyx mori]